MFYSHEVLTSRKYGVATVWLVATLGASTKLKRINKKAIREVDVPKACQTIIDPGAPMALRLQGNLLYGVSRVFLEQCGYVLSDAQNAHTAMRMMLKVVKNAALDLDAGRARPDQLILQDDPSFLPEFALPPPELLSEFNFLALPDTRPAGDSQSLTPFNSQVQHEPTSPAGQLGGLVLPSSMSEPVGEFRIGGDDVLGSFGGISGPLGGEDIPFQLEEAFTFNDNGDCVDVDATRPPVATPQPRQGAMMASDAAASARVRAEHEEGQQGGVELLADDMEVDIPFLGDDLPEGESFPGTSEQPQSDNTQGYQADESELSADAPMRRKTRKPKVIPRDLTNELHNKDLAGWSANYLQNMAEVSRSKNAHKAPLQAKKNAEFWVWGSGIGAIGHRAPGASLPTPWDIFCGDNLYELFTGKDRRAAAGKKHGRDSGIDEQMVEEARRVRHRLNEDEQQFGRGLDDEGMILLGDEEVELPRDEPAALDDQQIFSAMPWNISASNRGSSAVPRSTGLQGSLQQRRSRMVSESPLKNRGQPGDLEALRHLSGDDSLDISGIGLPEQFSSDGIYLEQEYIDEGGSPVRVPTRVHEALSAEGGNFLEFIADAINEKRQRIRAGLEPMSDVLQAEAAADMDEVLFEELLPPKNNSKMIACQGLLMVLTLATAGMLYVRQDRAFAEIGLSMTAKAKITEVEENVAEGYEGDEEEEAEPEEKAAEAGEPMEKDNPEPEQLPEEKDASDDEHAFPELAAENRHAQMEVAGAEEGDEMQKQQDDGTEDETDATESESDVSIGDDGSDYEE